MAKKSRTKKKQNETILILVEGSTEKHYFNYLKNCRGINVKKYDVPGDRDGQKILDLANSFSVEKENIFLVYDIEFGNNSRKLKLQKYFDEGFNVIATGPCFEIWLILHLEKLSKNKFFKNQNEVIIYLECLLLSKLQIGKHQKSDRIKLEKIFNEFKTFQICAINNAQNLKMLNESIVNAPPVFSDIHVLVTKINELKNS